MKKQKRFERYEKINLEDKRIKQFIPLIDNINHYFGEIRIFKNFPDSKITPDTRKYYFKNLIHNNNLYLEKGRLNVKIRKGELFRKKRENIISFGKLEGIYLNLLEKNLKTQSEKFKMFLKLWVSTGNFKQEFHHPNGHMTTGTKLLTHDHHIKIHKEE